MTVATTHTLLGRLPTIAAAVMATLLAFAGTAAAQSVNRIAAVVNGDVITQNEVDSRRRLLALSAGITGETAGRANDQILRLLIDERLRTQEVARRRIPVTDQDIANAVGDIEQRNGLPTGGLRENLRRGNIDPRVLYDQIRAQVGWNRLLRALLGDQANIPQAAVDEYLAAYQARTGQPEYLVSEIFLPVSNPSQDAEVQRFTADIIARLRQGAPFTMVATQFSQSQTAMLGGDLGWVQAERLDPEVAAIVRQMPEGAISNPIRVPGGYVIAMMRQKRTAGRDIATLLTVRQAVYPFEGQVNPVAPTAQQMRQVERAQQLSETARSCDALDGAARDGARVNDPGQVRLDNVNPPELRELLSNLPLGRPSQPIIAPDGVMVLVVCARETKNLAEVTAEQARDRLIRERVELISRQMLRDLQRRAQIDIRTATPAATTPAQPPANPRQGARRG
ncbi:peptidylprolyl isomerase [Roseomonas sp. HJA6]|uniref:Parvulin-like PPIase n=1 Tax=Roseomonas alba TaxID=2846776 RepID=A0ABS7A664_9PROT|nr:peptidylprolyl isomerase [Neoroseomonas alba]MBW6397797.1 peptidylprolyl isomerase [Neoroseomonas alba]